MRWTHIDEHLVGDIVIVDLRDPHLMQLDPEGRLVEADPSTPKQWPDKNRDQSSWATLHRRLGPGTDRYGLPDVPAKPKAQLLSCVK